MAAATRPRRTHSAPRSGGGGSKSTYAYSAVAAQMAAALAKPEALVRPPLSSDSSTYPVPSLLSLKGASQASVISEEFASFARFVWNRTACTPAEREPARTSEAQEEDRISFGKSLESMQWSTPPPRKRYFGGASELHQKVLVVLNKVSDDQSKYQGVKNELLALPYENATNDQIEQMVSVFFSKAIREPRFSALYAQLVSELVPHWDPTSNNDDFSARLRRKLIAKCQEEFEKPFEVSPSQQVDPKGFPLVPEEIEAMMDRRKQAVIGNVRFVGDLYRCGLVGSNVISLILQKLILSPASTGDGFAVPKEYEADLLLTILKTTGGKFSRSKNAHILGDVLLRARDLAISHPVKRVHFLMMDVADLCEKGFAPPPFDARQPASAPPQYNVALSQQQGLVPPTTELVASAMNDLVQTRNIDPAIGFFAGSADKELAVRLWVNRALTAVRCEGERQQLPYLLNEIVDREILPYDTVIDAIRRYINTVVDDALWVECPRLWRHWATVLAIDDQNIDPRGPSRPIVLTQEFHNYSFGQLLIHPAYGPEEYLMYLNATHAINEDREYYLPLRGPARLDRFDWLPQLVRQSSRRDAEAFASSIVQSSTLSKHDMEAKVFLAVVAGDTSGVFEELRSHKHLLSPMMPVKVISGVICASIVCEEERYLKCLDLLHLVVDAEDRQYREALMVATLVGFRHYVFNSITHVSLGFRLTHCLQSNQIVSQQTLVAFRAAFQDPEAVAMIAPYTHKPGDLPPVSHVKLLRCPE